MDGNYGYRILQEVGLLLFERLQAGKKALAINGLDL